MVCDLSPTSAASALTQREPDLLTRASSIPGEGQRCRRVLLTAPLLDKPGGVSQYMRVLLPSFHCAVQHFPIGARRNGEGGIRSLWRLVSDWILFARKLSSGSFDLVHLNPSLGPKALIRDGVLLLLAKSFGKPVFVFLHGWDEVCERRYVRPAAWLFRAVYGQADCMAVLAGEFARKLRSLGYKNAIVCRTAPVEAEILECAKSFSRVDSAGNSETKQFRILFLARVERAKGIYEALDAYEIVQRAYPETTLAVVGSGSELTGAVRYAERKHLAGISFYGHLEGHHKIAAFQAADVYLFPSYSEGLPISVLEAMACGLPIVASAVGGLRDFFEDGKMGYCLPCLSPESLAEKLCQLRNDTELRFSMSRFNEQYAREHFEPGRVAAELEAAYELTLRGALCAEF